MLAVAEKFWTPEEYWDFAAEATEKYEYFRGRLDIPTRKHDEFWRVCFLGAVSKHFWFFS